MRIIVMSDTHRNFRVLYDLVQLQKPYTDLFIHLGDGEREVDDLLAVEPDLPFKMVRGNCDLGSILPLSDVVAVDHVKIFLTHGHEFSVKYSLDQLTREARNLRAQIVLYGHTHCADYHYENGLHIMNPGSLAMPRGSRPGYGLIEIEKKQIHCSLCPL